MNQLELQNKLQEVLSEHRFSHSLGVSYTSASLAMRYGESIDQALTAGILHDCAKYMTEEKLLKQCHKWNIQVTKIEEQNPSLLHAKLGVYYAKEKYGVEEESVLDAIRYHITGRPSMTLLEKIVFVADYIEPSRKGLGGLEEIRARAFHNLDETVYLVAFYTLQYLEHGKKVVDPMTKETYFYYKTQLGM